MRSGRLALSEEKGAVEDDDDDDDWALAGVAKGTSPTSDLRGLVTVFFDAEAVLTAGVALLGLVSCGCIARGLGDLERILFNCIQLIRKFQFHCSLIV